MKVRLLFILLISVIIFTACSSSKKGSNETQTSQIGQTVLAKDTFLLPDLPESLTDAEARAKYLVMHFWEKYDFTNRTLIVRPEVTEQAFVDYINILNYVPQNDVRNSIEYTLQEAQKDSAMYVHFVSLFEKYLYEPNSPFRNEEFYIPVLDIVAKSSFFPPEIAEKYQFQQEMVNKNRIGEKAANFNYTLASGKTESMHGIRSNYLLIMFSNPGCQTCAAVTRQILNSQAIQQAFGRNSKTRKMLTIITIYPDNNLDEWTQHLPDMPQQWINAYDKDMDITKKRLYDIKAIPTLYLLDKDKRVILKDASLELLEEFFSSNY